MTPPSISVVICAYADERWDALVKAVRSVERQEHRAAEIVIAVDHNAALAARVRAELPASIVVENRTSRGLSGARNSGISIAHAEVIAFLDDDAVAEPDWLACLSEGFNDPSVVGVGGSIEPAWSTGRPAWFPEEFDWVVGCTYRGMPRTTAPIRNLIGANMAFRREIFDEVGGFRSGIGRVGTLPVGCEETELCIRIRQRFPEATLLYEPRARIFHEVPSHRSTWGYYLRRCYAEGRSKTMVAQHVGLSDGLASERHYTVRTLPAGVLRGLGDLVRHADPLGTARAAAIVVGLATTTAGFAISQVSDAWTDRPGPGAAPRAFAELEGERLRQIGVAARDGPTVAPIDDR
jgi:GT2 family glycosyltransferase